MKKHLARHRHCQLFDAIVVTCTRNADSVTTFADIDTWVGLGSQEAALVLDWNDGNEPSIWGYRFDGPKLAKTCCLKLLPRQRELFARVGPDGTLRAFPCTVSDTTVTVAVSESAMTWATNPSMFSSLSNCRNRSAQIEFDCAADSNDPGRLLSRRLVHWILVVLEWFRVSRNGGWTSPPFGSNDRIVE